MGENFKGTYEDFLYELGKRESSNRYSVVNTFGYLGKYQFGEAALKDVGFYKGDNTRKNDWNGEWTGICGVNNKEDFLNNPFAQEIAVRRFHHILMKEIKRLGLDRYIGKEINGIKITESGLLAAAHLLGIGNLKRYLVNNGKGIYKDGFGTNIEEYLRKFSGYNITEVIEFAEDMYIRKFYYNNQCNLKPKNPLIDQLLKDFYGMQDKILLRRAIYGDPLVVDLDGDGIETIGLDNSNAMFDLDGDGFREKTGWVSKKELQIKQNYC